MKTSLQNVAERLMRCPAAPYHESLVAAEAVRICDEHNLRYEFDSFGNLLIKLRHSTSPPMVLAAHMDHPGFVVPTRSRTGESKAQFLGGVGDDYFQPGIKIRLFPGNIPARLGKRLEKATFEIIAPSSSDPEFAVWDLVDFQLKDGKITGRACDDLVGAATILHVLIELARAKSRANVIGVLSRAEEVGFHGALALAQSSRLPAKSFIISLETSRELPAVKMGGGVIIRVGDRASVFDSAGSRFLSEVAGVLAKDDPSFRHQRALMAGGTCEATAYQEYGYRCAAVCVALGNYHNCAPKQKIAAEYVSLSDAESMSVLLQRCAIDFKSFGKIVSKLPKRLKMLEKEAVRKLQRKKTEGNSLSRFTILVRMAFNQFSNHLFKMLTESILDTVRKPLKSSALPML